MFQGSLFETDAEVLEREQKRIARKLAWEQGKPFPEDHAKWCAAHRSIINERCKEWYRQNYVNVAEYYLRSAARYRAEQLGCKIGRRGPILEVYRRAVRAPVLLCYWCKKVTKPGERHVDHKEPLATGGAHVAGNLCITCQECNLSKGDTSPQDFRRIIAGARAANSLLLRDYFMQDKPHYQDP
jgi:5-methylcytosine-specific restriction endonuclease McrA